MILKIKAFIYRFSAVFGLRIYLAEKEEQAYLNSQEFDSQFAKEIAIGIWQGKNGFTTVWTYKKSFFKALSLKFKHAFDFRTYND